jgi:hypothetical protein
MVNPSNITNKLTAPNSAPFGKNKLENKNKKDTEATKLSQAVQFKDS